MESSGYQFSMLPLLRYTFFAFRFAAPVVKMKGVVLCPPLLLPLYWRCCALISLNCLLNKCCLGKKSPDSIQILASYHNLDLQKHRSKIKQNWSFQVLLFNGNRNKELQSWKEAWIQNAAEYVLFSRFCNASKLEQLTFSEVKRLINL